MDRGRDRSMVAARPSSAHPQKPATRALRNRSNADPPVATAPFSNTRLSLLTPREQEALRMIANGLSTSDISRSLGITTHTVRAHMKHVRYKLGVFSTIQAVSSAQRLGFILVDGLLPNKVNPRCPP